MLLHTEKTFSLLHHEITFLYHRETIKLATERLPNMHKDLSSPLGVVFGFVEEDESGWLHASSSRVGHYLELVCS